MFNHKTIIQLKNKLAFGSNSLIFEVEEVKNLSNKLSYQVVVSKKDIEYDKLVAKVSNKNNLTELEILKKARLDKFNYISCLEGHSELMINDSCFLLYRAERDVKSINRPIDSVTQKHFNLFFENVMEYLKSLNIVYCDWKPSNILDYGNYNFKLTDFGSCLQNNFCVQHPNNINPIYCSPYLMNLYENISITPRFRDDLIGAAYVYLWLKDIKLPWSYFEPKKEENNFFKVFQFIFYAKTDENIHMLNLKNIDIPSQYKTILLEIYNDFKLRDFIKL